MNIFILFSITIFILEMYILIFLCKIYCNSSNNQNNILDYNFGAIELEEIPPNYENSIDIPNYIESQENLNIQLPPPY